MGAGGLWTLERTGQGMRHDTAEITARYSLYGSAGSGTEADPLKFVDEDEMAELDGGTLTSGMYVALRGVDGLDFAALALGSGLSLTDLGGGVWRIDASADGKVATSVETTYSADSVQIGPDRATSTKDALPVAYSGDSWIGDAAKAATLTFTSPRGTATTLDLAGTGATQFTFSKSGEWTVTLTMADGTTRTAVLSVSNGLTIVIK